MVLRYAAEQMTSVESVRAAPNCGCITPDNPTADDLNTLIDAVSDTIARLSGMYVRGRQTLIARPCFDGFDRCCPCCGLDGIPLGDFDPVISAVWINGVQLDESEYTLHSTLIGWRLVRLRTAAQIANNQRPSNWPSWQDRWRDYTSTTDTPTFAVIFTTGTHIDNIFVETAANELVCDLLTEGTAAENALGDGVISADLDGLNVQLSSDRISQLTERLDRIAAGQMGPAFTRFMGLMAPHGRNENIAWAPELMGGWHLNLNAYTVTITGSGGPTEEDAET